MCGKMVETLLRQGLIVNPEDVDNPGLLNTAVEKGYLRIAEDLLKYGADVNKLSGSRFGGCCTPLHSAVKENSVKMARLLINHEACVNVKDSHGKTPIVYAISRMNTKMIRLLLTNGADIKQVPNALCTAAMYGNLKLVEDLLKYGADVNMIGTSKYCLTPLRNAVHRKQVEVAKLLINYGADVNVKDGLGTTPMVYAIENRDTEMTKLLLINGADIKEDPNSLYTAVVKGGLKFAEDVLKYGADVNMVNVSLTGRRITPLHRAVDGKQVEMAELLINYGANVDVEDADGATPIVHAIRNRDTEMTELLLTNCADVKEDPKVLCTYSPTTVLLKQHIAKVKAAGLHVSERNLLLISNDHEINDFLNECEAEIGIMTSEKIDNSCASFLDILTKDTSELAKNESIVQALKSNGYKTKFPIYAGMIDSRFRRGINREKLLEQVRNKFLHSLFESLPELPLLCTEKIFSYLSDKDLRILLVACELFHII